MIDQKFTKQELDKAIQEVNENFEKAFESCDEKNRPRMEYYLRRIEEIAEKFGIDIELRVKEIRDNYL